MARFMPLIRPREWLFVRARMGRSRAPFRAPRRDLEPRRGRRDGIEHRRVRAAHPHLGAQAGEPLVQRVAARRIEMRGDRPERGRRTRPRTP
jgi:hypothetical protein